MKRVVFIAVFVLIMFGLSIAQMADNQYRGFPTFGYLDYNSSGFGARSRAMGGVYMALNHEGFNSFLNPACMVYTEKSVMSMEVVSSQDEYKDKYLYRELFLGLGDTVVTQDPFAYITYHEMDGAHTKLIQAGAVTPFTYFDRDLWFGGGFRTVYDLHVKFDTQVEPTLREIFTVKRGIDALNMSLAAKPVENIGLGLNLNYYVRGYESNLYFSNARQRDRSNFSGVNFDFGAVADFEIVRLGLVIRTGYTLTQKSVYFHSGGVNVYGDDAGLLDRITVKTKFPMTYGGGLSVFPMENFMLAFDIDLRPYSKVRLDIDNEHLDWMDFYEFDPEWEDLTQFRIGAEYVFDAGFADVPLRAGFHILPSLKTNESYHIDTVRVDDMLEFEMQTISKGDQMTTNILSFGTGMKFDKIWFDVAYEFGSSKHDNTISIYRGYTLDEPLEYKYSRLYISMGMLF